MEYVSIIDARIIKIEGNFVNNHAENKTGFSNAFGGAINNYDEAIHLVKFSISWHRQSIKKDGGWSLEMMDTGNPCAGEENWDSSRDAKGGTPGQPNSIAAENPDVEPPAIIAATVTDSRKI